MALSNTAYLARTTMQGAHVISDSARSRHGGGCLPLADNGLATLADMIHQILQKKTVIPKNGAQFDGRQLGLGLHDDGLASVWKHCITVISPHNKVANVATSVLQRHGALEFVFIQAGSNLSIQAVQVNAGAKAR